MEINQDNIWEVFEKARKKLAKAKNQCNVCGKFKKVETFFGCYKSKMIRVLRICKKCQKGFVT